MTHTLKTLTLIILILSAVILFLVMGNVGRSSESPALTETQQLPTEAPETTSAIENAQGREAFLNALQSQLGSTGQILPEGERYAAWFARRQNYRVEPWEDADVAWCVCFLYWGMAQCGELDPDFGDDLLRTADVDLFFASFTGARRKTESPLPGDIAFFDTDPTDEDPTVNHAGAVLEVTEDTIYIIEGNTLRGRKYPTGVAAIREYALTDPSILGYGVLDWK